MTQVFTVLGVIYSFLFMPHPSLAEAELTPKQKQLKAWDEKRREAYGKVYDPYHPWFDPDQFRFEDYSFTQCTRWEVLAKLFPPGTPKAFVDRVLVNAGGAKAEKVPEHVGHNTYSYFIEMPPGPRLFMTTTWNVVVQYDEHNQAVDVKTKSQSVYDFSKNCRWGDEYGKKWSEK